jgi:Zn-dependent protease with chaperone function
VNATSLAGFVLVFVTCAWALSAIGGGLLAVKAQRGPLVARRLAVAVAIVPLVLAGAVTIALMLQSALGIDHCPVHGDHAHLCLTHGTQWLQLPWVVVSLAVIGAAILGRLGLLARTVLHGRRAIGILHAISDDIGAVRVVETDRAFCFVAGRTPAVYVSAKIWAQLADDQRSALLAHEAAHVANGDLRMRGVLEVCLAFAAPLVGDRVRTAWLAATERLCDARAAEACSPATVASTMVALFRLQAAPIAGSFGLTPTQAELAARVEAVLAARPLDDHAAKLAGRLLVATCAGLIAGAALVAEPLHHAFETLLG